MGSSAISIILLISVIYPQSQHAVESHTSNGSNCIWSGYNNGVYRILDLTPLKGHNITGTLYVDYNNTPILNYTYLTYTPCMNGIRSCFNSNSHSMVTLFDPWSLAYQPKQAVCTNGAYWDNGTVSPFNTAEGDNFMFPYYNGDLCDTWYGSMPFMTWILYICRYDRYPLYIASFGVGQCTTIISIETYLACPDIIYSTNYSMTTTSSTSAPNISENECFWNDLNHQLNLTRYKGRILTNIDNQNHDKLWILRPCDNSVYCYLFDVTQQKCIQYVSMDNNDEVIPHYDITDNLWKFTYLNKKNCNIFQVYWICDYSNKNIADIVQVKEIDECRYEMKINSSSVCN